MTESERFTQYNLEVKRLNMLPIKVTPHYQRLVEMEVEALGQTGGPLYRVVYPIEDRLNVRADHEVPDFVEDRTNMPADLHNVLIHKYHKRALFLVTDTCAGHCMYCFRQDVLSDMHAQTLPAMEQKLDAVVDYLVDHPQIREVILSGGDPLNVPLRYLEQILARLKRETAVEDIRVHTRNVVFAPRVLSEEVCRLLGSYGVRVYLHVVHPYELAEEVTQGVHRLHSYGVHTYSQFPILRGINDHVAVLEQLLRRLDSLQAHPINIFIPDPISYSASFRMPMARLLRLMDELYWNTSSWTNGVRLVLDTPIGKVRREDIVAWDHAQGVIAFEREGKQVLYHDFPETLDVPGDPAVLLWQQEV
ncbi:MAG: radical SAM protein [Oscillochloris sp.]|nr:radical SAM protein [Oscillochloris sp.]